MEVTNPIFERFSKPDKARMLYAYIAESPAHVLGVAFVDGEMALTLEASKDFNLFCAQKGWITFDEALAANVDIERQLRNAAAPAQ
jgi:hypothetical protein